MIKTQGDPFQSILERIVRQDIQRLVVAHRDRLCRFGWELVEWLCKYNAVQLVVLNEQQLSPEQELVQDMLSIIHCFSSRLYGLRKYRKEITSKVREEPLQKKPECPAEQSQEDSPVPRT
ncbi:MAG: recombinase family protein [Hormoscilla sp. GUM202]|nr:recombinase family protein [Hormoscilla sp. GUM202]